MNGCNITESNLYYIRDINNIVKFINGGKSQSSNRRIIYVIENKEIMENFEMIKVKCLEGIVMEVPKKKSMEKGITNDILKIAFCIIKEVC